MNRKFLAVWPLMALLTKWQNAHGQVPLSISTSGVDEIKIGMSKSKVKQTIHQELQPKTFVFLDSILQISDTTERQTLDKSYEIFVCDYKDIALALEFQKSDSQLVGIVPTTNLPVVMTKSGIKTGISEKHFINICKRNHFKYDFDGYNLLIDLQSRGCLFSDNPDARSSKAIVIQFANGIATKVSVINFIGN